jgi:DNA-binding LytR/AlgR family response regulator
MQIEIKIDEQYDDLKILILANKMTEEVNEILNKLSETQPIALVGFIDDSLEILKPEDVIRVYSENQKVLAQTDKNKFFLRLRLYEVEERLSKNGFVRISNSEIINMNKVVKMDMNLSGTICVRLLGNISTFASRRYVPKIKQVLGLR